jgi:RNA-directed DNA polymerase
MISKPLRSLFDALQHGKYTFEDFLSLDVGASYDVEARPKRTIYRPSKKLKAFQAFLNNVLFEHLPINERVSFAYRKGASLRQAVEVHASGRAFYQADFSRFFESIDADLVRKTIAANETPIQDISDYIDRIIELTTTQGRLPIGFVTSPTISSACLKEFDDHLEAACLERGLAYSRYADDIVISAPGREALDGLEALVSQLAQEKITPHMVLNPAKTKRTSVGRRVQILGLDILPTGRVTVSREIREKVEYLVHFLVSGREKFEEINGGNFDKGLQQLGGYVSHIHSADPLYLAKLRKKFGATIIDSLLHKSLGDESN